MARRSKRVEEALDRWVTKGLLDESVAHGLRAEAEVAHAEAVRRWGQILVASLGAVALILAAGLFAERSWPRLTDAMRTGFLVVAGLAVYLLGLRIYRRLQWRYSGILLQVGGLGVGLAGMAYSANAWEGGTAPAIAVGLLALLVPTAAALPSFRAGVLMSAVHTAISFGFLAVFLERTFGLGFEGVVWGLDVVAVLAMGVFALGVRRWPEGHTDRALVAFAVSLWAGLVLVFMTAAGPMDLEAGALWPMDAWLLLIVAVTLWGIHRAPSEYRRAGYESNLAACVVVGSGLAMVTAGESLGMGTPGVTASGGLVGVAGLVYGLRWRAPQVLISGAAMMLLATWIFAVEQAGAMGGVLALLVSAGVLFWVSTRIRAAPEPEDS